MGREKHAPGGIGYVRELASFAALRHQVAPVAKTDQVMTEYQEKRLGLVLTPTEKTVVVQMAEAEGCLSQSAQVRRLIRNAAREQGIWPADKPRHTIQHNIREVQHG
jgi:hypothetical protein